MKYLQLAIVLFVAALVAGLLGFQPVAVLADDGAKVLVLVAIVLFVFTLVAPKKGPPVSPA